MKGLRYDHRTKAKQPKKTQLDRAAEYMSTVTTNMHETDRDEREVKPEALVCCPCDQTTYTTNVPPHTSR